MKRIIPATIVAVVAGVFGAWLLDRFVIVVDMASTNTAIGIFVGGVLGGACAMLVYFGGERKGWW